MRNRHLLRNWVFWGFGIGLLFFLVFPVFLPEYIVILITQSLIFAMAAISLDILLGYLGLAALGHMGYFAVGAYVSGILAVRYQFDIASCIALSMCVSALVAGGLGLLVLRARGVYFVLITLAFALCKWGLATRWVSLTGGYNGVVGIPRPELGLPWSMYDILPFYYLILFIFLICLTFIMLLIRSPFGKTLVGIRDSESRMKVLGYNVWLHQYLAYIIAAGIAGLAGCTYAYYNGYVDPDVLTLQNCMKLVLMVGLGGQGTVLGSIIGAHLITFLENILNIYTDRWVMIMAAVYFVTATYTPQGILGLVNAFRLRTMKGAATG